MLNWFCWGKNPPPPPDMMAGLGKGVAKNTSAANIYLQPSGSFGKRIIYHSQCFFFRENS